MRPVVRVLSRGWRRGATRWYVGTTAVLALSITLLMVVSGLFAGMEAETSERVGDFYTADVRVQPQGTGAMPARTFFDLEETLDDLDGTADALAIRYESQGVLSRRGFLEAIGSEDDQFQIGDGDGDEVVALGAVIGISQDGFDRQRIAKHLVVGQLPGAGDGEGSIPIAMGLSRFGEFVTDEERDLFTSWPPPADQLTKFTFELTAAKVVRNEDDQLEDVVRRPAHLVGVFESGVDLLDGLTYVAPIEDMRQLNGHGTDDPVANVVVAKTDDPGRVHSVARQNGWISQGEGAFTDRYLGQLIEVLQGLSVLMTVFLFMLPAFLIIHGVGRQLETHNREIAVCHAIGVRRKTVRQALGWVVIQVAVAAIVISAVFTTIIGLILHWILPQQRGLPLPMDFEPTLLAIVLSLTVSIASVLIALWIAFRSQARQPLAETLRTF